MTSPMPETMSPREKVLLKPCPFCGGEAVAGPNFNNGHYVMCGADCDRCGGMVGYMKTEMAAIENWNRRTALASGSGDHAELARLAEAVIKGDESLAAAVRSLRAFHAAAKPATVLALIAEVAALRGERDDWRETVRFNERCWSDERGVMIDRTTEAERKLAEAVGLNDRAAELMRQCTDPDRFEGASTLNVYANMRAWLSDLSKEAERG